MLARLFESRAIRDPNWASWGRGDQFYGPGSAAGVAVTEDSALQLLSVFGCIRVISDSIAMLPVDTFRRRQGLQEQLPNPVWLDQPNVDTDRISFMAQSLVSLLLRGNAYWLVIRNPLGSPVELWNLHPDWVSVRRVRRAQSTREYHLLGQPFDGEIVQIPAVMLPGAIRGVDPITAARDAIGMGIAAQTFGSKFFAQGATPSGVIQAPGMVTPDQARELASGWRAAHGGVNKSNLPAILTGGMTYTPVSVTPEQAQFLETRRYTDEQIRELFGLTHPFERGGGGVKMTYANTEMLGQDFTRFTLMPWIARLESALARLLPRPQYAKFNLDAFLRADLSTRYDAYSVGIAAGFLTVNEARDKENLEPLPDMAVAPDPSLPDAPAPLQSAPTPPSMPLTPGAVRQID